MSTNEKINKTAYAIGGMAMALLLILSAVFYVQRTTFIDNPFQIFLLIQDQNIVVMAGRYPSIVIRWLPFWVMKAGGSIDMMMMAFSMAYTLFHALIFYLVSGRLKQPILGLTIPAMLLISNVNGFYWCNSELIQAISVCILTLSVYRTEWGPKYKLPLCFVLIVLCLFFHPLSVVILSFSFAFEINWKTIDATLALALVASISGFFIKKAALPNWYDVMKKKEFDANLEKYGSELWNIPALESTIQMDHMVPILLLLFCSTYLMMKSRSWYKILVTWGAFVSYFVLVSISDPNASYEFYVEVNHTPLLLIALWPVLYSLHSKKDIHLAFVVAIIMTAGGLGIILKSAHYSDRYDYFVDQMEEKSGDHYYANKNTVPMNLVTMEWSSPYESLIITSREGKSKTLYISNNDKPIQKEHPDQFIGTWKKYDTLNSQYFDLDKGDYEKLVE